MLPDALDCLTDVYNNNKDQNNATHLINALPGNSSVNTVQHATIEAVSRVRGDVTQRWVVVT
jgi:hypothetical protein